jgi:hypothetical protein
MAVLISNGKSWRPGKQNLSRKLQSTFRNGIGPPCTIMVVPQEHQDMWISRHFSLRRLANFLLQDSGTLLWPTGERPSRHSFMILPGMPPQTMASISTSCPIFCREISLVTPLRTIGERQVPLEVNDWCQITTHGWRITQSALGIYYSRTMGWRSTCKMSTTARMRTQVCKADQNGAPIAHSWQAVFRIARIAQSVTPVTVIHLTASAQSRIATLISLSMNC